MTETFTFEIESDLKNKMEVICHELGMSVATAFTMFARKFVREKKFPFELSINSDKFFSQSNIEYLEKVTSEIDAGKAKLEEHELCSNNSIMQGIL